MEEIRKEYNAEMTEKFEVYRFEIDELKNQIRKLEKKEEHFTKNSFESRENMSEMRNFEQRK